MGNQISLTSLNNLTSLNFNKMEDAFDVKNRDLFNASLDDPNLGHLPARNDSLLGTLMTLQGPQTSLFGAFKNPSTSPDPTSMRLTRKRSSLINSTNPVNYDGYPGHHQP